MTAGAHYGQVIVHWAHKVHFLTRLFLRVSIFTYLARLNSALDSRRLKLWETAWNLPSFQTLPITRASIKVEKVPSTSWFFGTATTLTHRRWTKCWISTSESTAGHVRTEIAPNFRTETGGSKLQFFRVLVVEIFEIHSGHQVWLPRIDLAWISA